MSSQRKPDQYHVMIDALVCACKNGSGQVGAARVHRGTWNPNANSLGLSESSELNDLLKSLSATQRSALANALAKEFEAGVFETLKVFEANQIQPFENGYEGGPHDDFVGRLGGWQWPRH